MQEETQKLGYSREGDVVTIRLAIDDYYALLFCLGAVAVNPNTTGLSLRTMNAIHAGRPLSEYRPYKIPRPDDK